MKINDMFASKWLRATDIDAIADDDGNVHFTIDHVAMEEVGDSEKPIVYFQEVDAGLVLNKTNANTIAGLFGNDTDAWTGKGVKLFTTEVDFQGKQVLSIRVRMKPVKSTRAQVAQQAEAPF